MKDTFFAIVIGAGPAGAAAASVLCEKDGLDVALVDRKLFPRDKSCGDGLGPGVVNCLDRLNLTEKFSELSPIKTVSVSGPSGVEASGYLPKISGKPAIGFVVPRKKFDNLIFVNAIENGAVDYSGHSFTSFKYDSLKGLWSVSLKRESDGQKVLIYSKVLLGADGATSKVRRALSVDINPPMTTGVGIRSYCKIENLRGELRLDFIRPLLPAYGWIFPIGNGVVNFGVGIDTLRLQNSGKSLQQLLADYQQWANRKFGAQIKLTDKLSAPLPYAVPFSKLAFSDGPAALIGDAASMINPLTGEGIFYGMHAGITCAEALHEAYSGQVSLESALKKFEHDFKIRFTSHFVTNWKMKKKVASPTWSDLVIRACANDGSIMDELVNLMMGDKKNISNKMVLKIGLRSFFG